MLIIGEKLNSSITSVREAIHNKDSAFIQDLVVNQVKSGAQVLDVNTALEDEVNDMEWVISAIQEVADVPICIDSTNPAAVERALKTVKGRAMINSITMEKSRIKGILPLVLESGCPVIALTMDDNGIPKTVEDRLNIARQLVDMLSKNNYNLDNVYIDPLVLPLSVSSSNAAMFFKCISEIKQKIGVKTVSGLSNVSQSLPLRKIINRYFLAISMSCGMDAAILNPLDKRLMTAVVATELLMDNDKYARKYLKAYRASSLEE
jgi:cobalamin-dependent methionine synthase I